MEWQTKEEICYIFSGMVKEIFFLFNREGEILYWNKSAEEALGYKEGFNGINMADILDKALWRKEGRIEFKDDPSEGQDGDYHIAETVAYRKNQTVFPVEVRLNLKAGRERYGICVMESLETQKNAQRNVKKAQVTIDEMNHLKTEFVANVTHELKTPMNGIMGFTENLLDTEITKEQEEYLRIIKQCCNNMKQIIDNLLDFSKLGAGKFTIEEKEFCFREFMDKTMEINLAEINDKGLRLMVSISPDIPDYVIGDELRLTQILNNLISNAIKFTSAGQITVEVTKTMETEEEMELFFMVIDTGIGISEEDKDKLFKSFSQVDASITRRFGGTGLGLKITKELVNLMNGEIDVQSEKGKGSTFSFSVRLKKSLSHEEAPKKEILNGWYTYEGMGKVKIESEEIPELKEVYEFGSPDNQREMKTAMDRLILCIEMDNWKKAENFAGTVKELIPQEEKELYRKAFRLELTVRKEAKENALTQYEDLKKAIDTCYEQL